MLHRRARRRRRKCNAMMTSPSRLPFIVVLVVGGCPDRRFRSPIPTSTSGSLSSPISPRNHTVPSPHMQPPTLKPCLVPPRPLFHVRHETPKSTRENRTYLKPSLYRNRLPNAVTKLRVELHRNKSE